MAEEGRGEDVKYILVPRLSSSFLSLSVQFKGLQVTKLAGQLKELGTKLELLTRTPIVRRWCMSHTTTRPRHIMLSIILGIIGSEKHKGNNTQKSLDQ